VSSQCAARDASQVWIGADLYYTHPALLAGFADRVIIMYAGRSWKEVRSRGCSGKPLHPYTKGLLRLFPNSGPNAGWKRLERLPEDTGTLTEEDLLTPGCVFEPRCSARTAVCRSDAPVVEVQDDQRVSCFHHGE